MVKGWKGRLKRLPAASVGDYIYVVVTKGPPDLRKQVFGAIVIMSPCMELLLIVLGGMNGQER